MNKPRIFLGSSGKQAKLLQAITRGLEDVADVEPWTTTFNPGRSTLDRLVELSQEVDFAAFVFAQDDWTTTDASQSGQASPRDNVVFEAGLFGGALGIRRTFILHANGSKLPSDLLGLTSVRNNQPSGGSRDQPEAPQGDRDRGSPRTGRGVVVAALAHHAERG
jgi:predicted nucleotide-binding protein